MKLYLSDVVYLLEEKGVRIVDWGIEKGSIYLILFKNGKLYKAKNGVIEEWKGK